MRADDFIKARIDSNLKQEFQDICSEDMSKVLKNIISDYVDSQKAKYTVLIIKALQDKDYYMEGGIVLSKIIDSIEANIRSEDPAEIQLVIDDLEKNTRFKDSDELIILIYRNLLRGLYSKGKKESISVAVERLYRNKNEIINYIQDKVL